MDGMKCAVLTVCAISAVKCLVGNVAAASRMRGQLMLMFDLILAAAVLTPIAAGIRDFRLPELNTADYADFGYSRELYEEALRTQTARNIEEILMEQLTAAGIDCTEISADVNISDDGSISITKVTVTTGEFESAAGVIRSTLGWDTEVTQNVDG